MASGDDVDFLVAGDGHVTLATIEGNWIEHFIQGQLMIDQRKYELEKKY